MRRTIPAARPLVPRPSMRVAVAPLALAVLVLAGCEGRLVRLGNSSPDTGVEVGGDDDRGNDGGSDVTGDAAGDVAGDMGGDAGSEVAADGAGADGRSGDGGADKLNALGCATTPSTRSQTLTFNTASAVTSTLVLVPMPARPEARLDFTQSGPPSKPTLCTAGCAMLSMAFTTGMPAWTSISAEHVFPAWVNLVGATVTFTIAIDNPDVPIQIQVFTGDGTSQNATWTEPARLDGSNLAPYDASNGLQDFSLKVTDHVGDFGTYCAAATAVLGIQLQNNALITPANAGTVTVYIGNITIQ